MYLIPLLFQFEFQPFGLLYAWQYIVDNLSQEKNTASPILVTLFGINTFFSDEQNENAKSPILVTLLPIVRLVIEWFSAKAIVPIVVTLDGISMNVKFYLFSN